MLRYRQVVDVVQNDGSRRFAYIDDRFRNEGNPIGVIHQGDSGNERYVPRDNIVPFLNPHNGLPIFVFKTPTAIHRRGWSWCYDGHGEYECRTYEPRPLGVRVSGPRFIPVTAFHQVGVI